MKTHYSAKEIARALGLTERAVQVMANKLMWRFEKRAVRGGKKHFYVFEALPLDVQRAVIAFEMGAEAAFVPEKVIDEEGLKNLLAGFMNAPDYNRRRAEARFEILQAAEQYVEAAGMGISRGEEAFTALYGVRAVNSLEPWVYEAVAAFSVTTFRRWKKDCRTKGLAGLLPGFGQSKGQVRAISPAMKIYLTGQIADKPSIRPARLVELLNKRFPGRAPDRSTVYRWVAAWKKKNHEIYCLMRNPQEHKNKYTPAFGDKSADTPHFGHTWEMDSTPADVMCADGKRCTLLGAIDVYSRRAVVVTARSSMSVAVAAVMRKGIMAWGVPSRIRKDNGKDYVSRHIQAITNSLEIETPELNKYAPEEKPFIERFFGTMTRQLEELLPGYVGHSVAERQAIRERATWGAKIMKRSKKGEPRRAVEIPLTMRELQLMIDEWLIAYEHRVHGGLEGALKGKSPRDASRECLKRPAKIDDERVLDILLAPVGKGHATVQKKGIFTGGGKFIADELVNHIGRKILPRHDLDDAGTIHVFDFESGKFICKATDEALKGQTLSSYIAAKKRKDKANRETVRALETISRNEAEPYTVVLDTGELINADTGEIIEEPEPRKVVGFTPKADTPAIREAKKAFEEKPKPRGLAEEMAEVIDLESRRAAAEPEPEVVYPREEKEPEERDFLYPLELLENPVALIKWYHDEAAKRTLSEQERGHVEYLHERYPWAVDFLEQMHRAQGE